VAADADAYWTVQPLTSTGALPRLTSSTKSFVNGAPVLPPPAKTWLTTTVDVAPWANGAGEQHAGDGEHEDEADPVHGRLR